MKNGWSLVLAATIMAIGIAIGGALVGNGFAVGREGARYVTVKGLSEREVKADLAIWPLRFVATSNALSQAQAKVSADARVITEFLKRAGIAPDEIEVQNLQVTDVLANPYRSGPIESRFIVAQTLLVRSVNVETIAAASQKIADLVEAGVVLGADRQPTQGPSYIFTRLNDIKPAMIAEATKSARAAAEQFAADSGSRIADIRRANQGLFQILPRDKAPGLRETAQIHKTVRVVSTVEYLLEGER